MANVRCMLVLELFAIAAKVDWFSYLLESISCFEHSDGWIGSREFKRASYDPNCLFSFIHVRELTEFATNFLIIDNYDHELISSCVVSFTIDTLCVMYVEIASICSRPCSKS
jgi:hypothetical protein